MGGELISEILGSVMKEDSLWAWVYVWLMCTMQSYNPEKFFQWCLELHKATLVPKAAFF